MIQIFQAVANTCDEDVSLQMELKIDLHVNGSFELDKSPKNILENILTTMAGHLIYSNGAFKLRPAVF